MADKPRSAISPLPLRPWLKGGTYERLVRVGVMHADIYAFLGADMRVYFLTCWSPRGRGIAAQDWFVLGEELEAIERPGQELTPLYWHKGTDSHFRRCHGALIARARSHGLEGVSYTTVLCHYIARPDVDPWPRGMVNGYRERGLLPVGASGLPDLL